MAQHAFRVESFDEISHNPLRIRLRLVELGDEGSLMGFPREALRVPRGFVPVAEPGGESTSIADAPQSTLFGAAGHRKAAFDPIRRRQHAVTCCQAQVFPPLGG